MKKYIKPSIDVVTISMVHMIAASGDDKTDVSISDTSLENTVFGARSSSLWDDDEE